MSILELSTATGDTLPVHRFRVTDRVSTLFSVEVTALVSDPALDLETICGGPATFRAVAGHAHTASLGTRTWSGLIAHAEQAQAVATSGGEANTSTYVFHLVPDVFRLTQRRNYRIFQQRSIPDIVKEVLSGGSIRHTWHIDRSRYPSLDYKVQYAETDFAFLCRLLEEAGIAFTFVPDVSGESVLTLSDRLESSPLRPGPALPCVDNPNEAAEMEFVTRVGFAREVRPGAVTVRDYDPRNPARALFAKATPIDSEARYEQYHHDAGAFLVETGKAEGTPAADDRGFARHDAAYGKVLAERMLHADRAGVRTICFDSNAYDLAPGSIVAIANHPHEDLPASRRLLVLQTTFEGKAQEAWRISVTTVPAEVPYRPPRVTPKPLAQGVQTATVVGPAGQEIHTDEFGRVRVELPWDRAGHHDQRSSCWVRVAQGWSGMGYGMMVLPRIGQEVLLWFLEGDPDQPIVGIRAYNAGEQVPYRLPEHKTRSTWKSDSSLGSGGFNEIMFEDLVDKELVWQQAQKDRTRVVENDELAAVLHDREKLVKNDERERTEGSRRRLVAKDADAVVKKDRRERVEMNVHLEVRKDHDELVKGDQSVDVKGNQQEKVTGRLALKADKQVHGLAEEVVGEGAEDVTLKGPGGFVRIDQGGITIVGTLVKINVSGNPGKGPGCKPAAPDAAAEAPPTPSNSGSQGPGAA